MCGGASIAIENGNLLMQETLVMTSAYTRMSVWTRREVRTKFTELFSWLNINQFTYRPPMEAT